MSDEKDRDLATDEERLLDALRSAARGHGFRKTWEAHMPQIADIQRRGRSGARTARLLHECLRADPESAKFFETLPSHQAELLTRELRDETQYRVRLKTHAPAPTIAARLGAWLKVAIPFFREKPPDVFERDGTRMVSHRKRDFTNWAGTVKNKPSYTFVPRTKEGVCNLVKWAAANGKRVRVAGYRHTWGDYFADTDEVLVSLLPLNYVEDLPAIEVEADPQNELQEITLVHEDSVAGTALCRIGAAVTNEMFREWCLPRKKSEWRKWTVPWNVIMVEITYGGSNAPICHGAGWNSTTLSDLVHEIEFVNARGELQTVSDPEQLKAAAGCFGLLGVVVSLTLRLDPMTFARMHPRAPRLPLAIPPPRDYPVPKQVDMSGITQAELDAARAEFVRACEDDYYVQWFWFAFHDRCWVNTWDNNGSYEDAQEYPNEITTHCQGALEFLAEIANRTIFEVLPGRWQAELLGNTAMATLPKDREVVTPLIDALHFQRGIQNMRVFDLELEIPIPPRPDDPNQPDWSIVQRAWWDLIRHVYERDDAPMRLSMELRITRDSKMIMAPQHGNRLGTCAIEVVTPANVDHDEWKPFMQDVADLWFSYTDSAGNPLNVRPHWSKQWQDLTFRGRPAIDHLKQVAYAERIPEFRSALQTIASAGGYSLADLRARFSNALLDELFEGVFG